MAWSAAPSGEETAAALAVSLASLNQMYQSGKKSKSGKHFENSPRRVSGFWRLGCTDSNSGGRMEEGRKSRREDSAECGIRNAEFGTRNSECGIRNAEWRGGP